MNGGAGGWAHRRDGGASRHARWSPPSGDGVTSRRAFGIRTLAGFFLVFTLLTAFGCAGRRQGRVVALDFEFRGMTRRCLVYLPRRVAPAMPAVFSFHGYGSSAEVQMLYAGMNSVADTAGFVAVYPEAVGHRWNSGIGDSPIWPTPDVDDVGFIHALIDTLAAHYGIDTTRVFACGMSNGGFMSYRLACAPGGRVVAGASVAGVMSRGTGAECVPARITPFLHIHGTADATVPYEGAPGWLAAEESMARWADLMGCVASDTVTIADTDTADGCRAVRVGFRDAAGVERGVFYRVEGGGHTWPGATFDLPGAGATNRDINASEEIWRFFRACGGR